MTRELSKVEPADAGDSAASRRGDPHQPGSYPYRALFLLVGLTPQVITETVYALTRPGPAQFFPTSLRIFTTGAGAEAIRMQLFERQPHPWHALKRDWALDDLPPIEEAGITVLMDGNSVPVDDVHDRDALLAMGTLVLEGLRQIIASPAGPDTAIHLSVAGGRKSMGTLAAQAMSLVGRDQDRLSHVLVSPPFEDAPDFFFPPRRSTYIHVRVPPSSPDDEPKWTLEDASKAKVDLAEIPFLRLGALLNRRVQARLNATSYASLVLQAQAALDEPKLFISLSATEVRASGCTFTLGHKSLAFLVALARRRDIGIASQASDEDVRAWLEAWAEIRRETERDTDAEIAERLADDTNKLLGAPGVPPEEIAEARTNWARLAAQRLDDKFKEELGDFLAGPYLLVKTERPVRYRLPPTLEMIFVNGPLSRGV
jgi:CRISPR-associated protein (TIGR02584 family)